MIPGTDLVIGLFIQVLLWLVVWFVRLVWNCGRTMLVDHPGLSGLLLVASVNAGWIDPGELAPWVPLAVAGLFGLATVRFLGEHSVRDVIDDARGRYDRRAESAGETAAKVRRAREWFHREPAELPAPPRAVTTERVTGALDMPLDDAGRRLFAYRENGWTGGVDQDGHPVDEHGTRVTATDAAGERIVADVNGAIPLGPAEEVRACPTSS